MRHSYPQPKTEPKNIDYLEKGEYHISMKKLTTLSILFISLAFVAPMQVSAATNAGIKPGSFFYFLDTASEKVSLFFTFSPEGKAQKALEYADERLSEIEAVAENKNPEAVKTATENYESNIALATEKSKEVKDKGRAETLLTSITDNASRNQEVLSAVLVKVPEEAKAAITQAIEASEKGQEEAVRQVAELKNEVEKLKKEVAELKSKETKVETNTQIAEVEKLKKEVEELKKQTSISSSQKQQTVYLETNRGTNTVTPTTQQVAEEKKTNTVTFSNGSMAEINERGDVVRWIKNSTKEEVAQTTTATPLAPKSNLSTLRVALDNIGTNIDNKNNAINYYLTKKTCVGLDSTQYQYCVDYAFNPTRQTDPEIKKNELRETLIQEWMKQNTEDFSNTTYKNQFNVLVSSYGLYHIVLP